MGKLLISAFGASKDKILGGEFTVGDLLNSNGKRLGISKVCD
jgi:hypothetical protein